MRKNINGISISKQLNFSIKKNRFLHFILSGILYIYLRILFNTYRLSVTSDVIFSKSFNHNEGIYYFWHQHVIACMFFFFKKRGVGYCLASASSDRKIIGSLFKKFGFKALYKKKEYSYISFIKKLLDILEINRKMYIAGDISSGTEFKLQQFTSYLAAKSKLPLIFIECKAECAINLTKGLVLFQVPLPFSKIHIHIHKPTFPTLENFKQINFK